MKKFLTRIALVAALGAFATPALAQGSGIYGRGLRIDLGDDKEKTRYIRFITWVQAWARIVENNPGTEINGSPEDASGDFMIRRARLLTYSQLTKNVLVMFHAGINNQTFRDFRTEFYVHDAWGEYTWHRSDAFTITTGIGLHYWNGPTRQSSASTLNFLTIDAPINNWPLIERQDQFARQLGFFVKGKIASGLIDYRAAVNRQFNPPGADRANVGPNTFGTQGYINVQLMDKESNLLPYFVGTYLGTKKVFNIGAGWNIQPEGQGGEDIIIIGGDVFFDSPIGANNSLTLYGSFQYMDFGDNALRSVGIANLASGGTADNGASVFGNAFLNTGTGFIATVEGGYAVPFTLAGLFPDETKLQPYYRGQLMSFDALDDVAPVFEAGFNIHLHGHHTKFTMHYRARPLIGGRNDGASDPSDNGALTGFANEFIAQTQVYL